MSFPKNSVFKDMFYLSDNKMWSSCIITVVFMLGKSFPTDSPTHPDVCVK